MIVILPTLIAEMLTKFISLLQSTVCVAEVAGLPEPRVLPIFAVLKAQFSAAQILRTLARRFAATRRRLQDCGTVFLVINIVHSAGALCVRCAARWMGQ